MKGSVGKASRLVGFDPLSQPYSSDRPPANVDQQQVVTS